MILINGNIPNCPTLNGKPVTMIADNVDGAIAYLKAKYDLDVLEVGNESLYLHFGRNLSNDELSTLTSEIHQIQEAME